ncbi:MAG: hypothetical protein ACR2QH_00005 [Geminicoccaceae bacterium]|jgi:hypothetical protein
MVDIISKRDGPRREDVAAKRVLRENRGTIHKMMDHLSGGQLRSMQQPAPAPEAEGLIIHIGRATDARDQVSPYVRISVNGRVVVADRETSRQLHFLGELRGPRRRQRFVLATKENGFFALVEDQLKEMLAEFDGKEISRDFSEEDLIEALTKRLGLRSEAADSG